MLKWSDALIHKKPASRATNSRQTSAIVLVDDLEVSDVSREELRQYKSAGYQVLRASWVWNSISHYELQDSDKFEVKAEELVK